MRTMLAIVLRRCMYCLLLSALTLMCVSVAAQSSPVNLDFEQGEPGQLPTGWFVPAVSKAAGYNAEVTEDNLKSGKRCAVLIGELGSMQKGFGNLMQSVEATSYRGKSVRFRAAVRVEAGEPGARAQLWLRVDRKNNKMGFIDNMGDRPISARDWRYYEIVADVDQDAARILFGVLFFGKTKAWIDDASFEVIGEPARPLNGQGLENLIAFTRVMGYVRHFHPSGEAAAADWTQLAIDGVRAIEPARDSADLARRLEAFFQPIAPTVRVFPTGKRPPVPRELFPPEKAESLKVTAWRHTGFGTGNPRSMYHSERLSKAAPRGEIPSGISDPRAPFHADLGGVSCLVPLALFADEKGTLPHSSANDSKPSETRSMTSGNDRATRLAAVALVWNVFQHFYPYFDVVKTDWDRSLRDALSSAASDSDARAFLNTLRRLVAQLHDGHGRVSHRSSVSDSALPLLLGWVEGRLVIIRVAPEGSGGLKAGDIVLKVDGQAIDQFVAEREPLISGATPQWIRYRLLEELSFGEKDSEVTLETQRQSGETYSIKLSRTVPLERFYQQDNFSESGLPKIDELKPGIFYLNLDQIKGDDFEKLLPKLESAKGIIFDVRGYPKELFLVISHLIDSPVTTARWNVPIVTYPDRKQMSFQFSNWPVQPIAPRLKAKIAFITDGRAISQAETFMGIIENYKIGDIVGETTAGTNGNYNPFMLPGGYGVTWTGMKVLKHDGSQHHGVGIKPTVPVSRTLRGVAEGRDEFLERAIEVVSR